MDYTNLCLGCMEVKGGAQICTHCGYAEGAGAESLLHLSPGTVLQDKFLLGRVLGQGGFGITYLAWDMTLNIKLAIKEYLPQQLVTRSAGQSTVTVYKSSLTEEFQYGLNKFLEEARTLARFNEHPNIVTVRDYFEANNTAYLVMNYHQGVTLQSYLESKGGQIPVEQALSIFMPILDALKEVHATGILHRDISPDNLLIDSSGRVVLIDFGAARQAMTEKSKSLSVIMKAGYSPPEQYQSQGKQGPWTDIYAVAATLYRTITGQMPLESIERMVEDDLVPPSQAGVKIDRLREEVLIKALAINIKDRYQMVEEFQLALIAGLSEWSDKNHSASEEEMPVDRYEGSIENDRFDNKVKNKAEVKARTFKKPHLAGKRFSFVRMALGSVQNCSSIKVSKKPLKTAAVVIFCGLFFYVGISIFGAVSRNSLLEPSPVEQIEELVFDDEEAVGQAESEPEAQTYKPALIASSDADYYIDYENGTIPLGDLPIGARVVDPSWEWEFRSGGDYAGSGTVKSIIWLVVAKNHYNFDEAHVTLLAEELIGFFAFDDSTDRGSSLHGNEYWGNSGTTNASHGLRPWLNSNGIHSEEGFYQAFSDKFKQAILLTSLPNLNWEGLYTSDDYVFIPSTTELGDMNYEYAYRIGDTYAYFFGAYDDLRAAKIENITSNYWTRSPAPIFYGGSLASNMGIVRLVTSDGAFSVDSASYGGYGIRPALNLKSETLVSEIKN